MTALGVALFVGALLLIAEVLLRVYRVRRQQGFFRCYPSMTAKALSFEPHPYVLYVKRPNCDGLYPSNSLGYAGKREVNRARLPNSVRIYCVGGSTVEAHEPDRGPNSSWPGKLQDELASRFLGTLIECINAGTAGYTSAESLCEFLFRGVDLRPDILLVYHNVNDAWTCQMVDGFKTDYSHARFHKPWRLGWANAIPQVSAVASYQLVRSWIVRRFGRPNSLIYWIADPPWRPVRSVSQEAINAFRRNILNLASVARAWSCVPVLVKWECDWGAARVPPLYREVDAEVARAHFSFLTANNRALEEVAGRVEGCHYIDVGPFEPGHFKDTIHFSASGLDEMARRLAGKIEPIVRSIVELKGGGR